MFIFSCYSQFRRTEKTSSNNVEGLQPNVRSLSNHLKKWLAAGVDEVLNNSVRGFNHFDKMKCWKGLTLTSFTCNTLYCIKINLICKILISEIINWQCRQSIRLIHDDKIMTNTRTRCKNYIVLLPEACPMSWLDWTGYLSVE